MEISQHGLNALLKQGLDSLSQKETELRDKMDNFANLDAADQNANLIELQFYIGQYNATVELLSSITKSISDTAKSISQKV